ncbi:MAG: 16S rRNA processing protein RimM [Desulfobulbaceae bacterium]|uniref:Ribosome maturation factor RimM n=1 Tax=Candidatus Desulfatifera sulfidica TaxID=2841691 RepID=A0A8J6N602_9BACT|nr:16S rRNA processing protein RimM [Candidatus Desulfatifera sulfidica]
MVARYVFPEDTHVLIGEIVKAHGIRGELKLLSYSGQPEAIGKYPQLTLVSRDGRITQACTIKRLRPQGHNAILTLNGIETRNQAEELVGQGVLVRKIDLASPQNDEYYWHQLQGLKVFTTTGRELGKISEIFSNGAHDLLVVTGGHGNKSEYLIPMLANIIHSQNDKQLIIDPPPGLLEINNEEEAVGEPGSHDI